MTTAVEELARTSYLGGNMPSGALEDRAEDPVCPDVDLKRLKLNGKEMDVAIQDSIVGGDGIERTMEGASTITFDVSDPHLELTRAGVLDPDNEDEIELDGLFFTLVHVDKNDRVLSCQFEDREVHWLRDYDKPLKAYRDKVTRAEFIQQMVREVKQGHINFFCPQLHDKQIEKSAVATGVSKQSKQRKRHPGFGTKKIEVKHVAATPSQKRVLSAVLDVGFGKRAKFAVNVAAIETVTQESSASTGATNGPSIGPFQQQPSWGSESARRDPRKSAEKFYDKAIPYYNQHPGAASYEIAQAVQGSGAGAAKYKQWTGEAIATVNAYSGSVYNSLGQDTSLKPKRFPFQRGGKNNKNEDSWACGTRLAQEVNWRLFMSNGWLYYADDIRLSAAEPRMTLSEDSEGVDHIDWGYDTGKSVQEVTVVCHADRWAAPPGSVVELEDVAPYIDGRWLVWHPQRRMFEDTATIVLRKPQKPHPEPPNPTGSSTSGKRSSKGSSSSGNKIADKVLAKAKAISRQNLPYVWGGGHGTIGQPSGGGYDCSGYVSACLHAAGILDSPMTSGALESWGHAGRGKHFTVWASSNHVWIQFHGMDVWRADTSPHGDGANGPHVRKTSRETSGFTARHYPGA
jgi:hypothetical protein